MNEITYGFVDNSNILIETAVCVENDIDTLERIKNEFNAFNYYKMNLEKESTELGIVYWTGTRFCLPSPYPSWVFNEELNTWETPIPYPNIDEENPKHYKWNEEIIGWEEVQISE